MQRQPHLEYAAQAFLAFEPDIAPQQAGQTQADRQPQATSAVLAGSGRIGLHERLEQAVLSI
ncbi:hypothetical protein D3C87_1658690 [compost metagenome]